MALVRAKRLKRTKLSVPCLTGVKGRQYGRWVRSGVPRNKPSMPHDPQHWSRRSGKALPTDEPEPVESAAVPAPTKPAKSKRPPVGFRAPRGPRPPKLPDRTVAEPVETPAPQAPSVPPPIEAPGGSGTPTAPSTTVNQPSTTTQPIAASPGVSEAQTASTPTGDTVVPAGREAAAETTPSAQRQAPTADPEIVAKAEQVLAFLPDNFGGAANGNELVDRYLHTVPHFAQWLAGRSHGHIAALEKPKLSRPLFELLSQAVEYPYLARHFADPDFAITDAPDILARHTGRVNMPLNVPLKEDPHQWLRKVKDTHDRLKASGYTKSDVPELTIDAKRELDVPPAKGQIVYFRAPAGGDRDPERPAVATFGKVIGTERDPQTGHDRIKVRLYENYPSDEGVKDKAAYEKGWVSAANVRNRHAQSSTIPVPGEKPGTISVATVSVDPNEGSVSLREKRDYLLRVKNDLVAAGIPASSLNLFPINDLLRTIDVMLDDAAASQTLSPSQFRSYQMGKFDFTNYRPLGYSTDGIHKDHAQSAFSLNVNNLGMRDPAVADFVHDTLKNKSSLTRKPTSFAAIMKEIGPSVMEEWYSTLRADPYATKQDFLRILSGVFDDFYRDIPYKPKTKSLPDDAPIPQPHPDAGQHITGSQQPPKPKKRPRGFRAPARPGKPAKVPQQVQAPEPSTAPPPPPPPPPPPLPSASAAPDDAPVAKPPAPTPTAAPPQAPDAGDGPQPLAPDPDRAAAAGADPEHVRAVLERIPDDYGGHAEGKERMAVYLHTVPNFAKWAAGHGGRIQSAASRVVLDIAAESGHYPYLARHFADPTFTPVDAADVLEQHRTRVDLPVSVPLKEDPHQWLRKVKDTHDQLKENGHTDSEWPELTINAKRELDVPPVKDQIVYFRSPDDGSVATFGKVVGTERDPETGHDRIKVRLYENYPSDEGVKDKAAYEKGWEAAGLPEFRGLSEHIMMADGKKFEVNVPASASADDLAKEIDRLTTIENDWARKGYDLAWINRVIDKLENALKTKPPANARASELANFQLARADHRHARPKGASAEGLFPDGDDTHAAWRKRVDQNVLHMINERLRHNDHEELSTIPHGDSKPNQLAEELTKEIHDKWRRHVRQNPTARFDYLRDHVAPAVVDAHFPPRDESSAALRRFAMVRDVGAEPEKAIANRARFEHHARKIKDWSAAPPTLVNLAEQYLDNHTSLERLSHWSEEEEDATKDELIAFLRGQKQTELAAAVRSKWGRLDSDPAIKAVVRAYARHLGAERQGGTDEKALPTAPVAPTTTAPKPQKPKAPPKPTQTQTQSQTPTQTQPKPDSPSTPGAETDQATDQHAPQTPAQPRAPAPPTPARSTTLAHEPAPFPDVSGREDGDHIRHAIEAPGAAEQETEAPRTKPAQRRRPTQLKPGAPDAPQTTPHDLPVIQDKAGAVSFVRALPRATPEQAAQMGITDPKQVKEIVVPPQLNLDLRESSADAMEIARLIGTDAIRAKPQEVDPTDLIFTQMFGASGLQRVLAQGPLPDDWQPAGAQLTPVAYVNQDGAYVLINGSATAMRAMAYGQKVPVRVINELDIRQFKRDADTKRRKEWAVLQPAFDGKTLPDVLQSPVVDRVVGGVIDKVVKDSETFEKNNQEQHTKLDADNDEAYRTYAAALRMHGRASAKYVQAKERLDAIGKELYRVRQEAEDYAGNIRRALVHLLPDGPRHQITTVAGPDAGEIAKTRAQNAAKWLSSAFVRRDGDPDLPAVGVVPPTKYGPIRAYYADADKHVALADVSEEHVAAHELGHMLEYNVPGVKEACQEFLKHRVKEEAFTDLRDVAPSAGYGKWERGRRNHFDRYFSETQAYYVGKDYGDSATEVLSMGIEALYRDPVNFMKKDPEYARFVLWIMAGRPTGAPMAAQPADEKRPGER